jgi:hypothetical protein
LTGKYARSAVAENQLLSAMVAEKYCAMNAGFLIFGVTAAAMETLKLSANPAIMIRK